VDADRARLLVEQIRSAVTVAVEAMTEAWSGRAWEVLGYESWDALCDTEFGVRIQLPSAERVAIVGGMSEIGMSTRAIGSALGVSKSTVENDRARGKKWPRDAQPVTEPARAVVVGLDGKPYTKTSKGDAVQEPKPSRATTWSRRVQLVSAQCPMSDLTDEQVTWLYGAAVFLRDYCRGELAKRGDPHER
jgi:hypothetical protein